jgi:hypothetical protein
MAAPQKLEEVDKDGNHAADVLSLHDAPAAVLSQDALDPVYAAKATVLNKAIQDIGMGRYQWQVRMPSDVSFHSHADTLRGRRRVEALYWVALAKLVQS